MNRNFFKSLGALEPMVREEARKAEEIFAKGAVADVVGLAGSGGAWRRTAARPSSCRAPRRSAISTRATSVLPAILAANPQLKED